MVNKSGFQIKAVRLKSIDYGINEEYDDAKYEGKEPPLKLSIEAEISKNEEELSAFVILRVNVSKKKDKNFPVWARVEYQGICAWDESMKDKADQMLQITAPAHLLAYVRPIISQLVALSSLPPIVLPLLDLTKGSVVKKMERRKQTVE